MATKIDTLDAKLDEVDLRLTAQNNEIDQKLTALIAGLDKTETEPCTATTADPLDQLCVR